LLAGGRTTSTSSHRRTQSESLQYDFGWDSDTDEDAVTASPAAAAGPPAAPSPERFKPGAGASPQRHRRSASAAQRQASPPLASPRATTASAEGPVAEALHALRGHAGAALIICLCVLLSLTARPASRAHSCAVRSPPPFLPLTQSPFRAVPPLLSSQGHGLVVSVALEAVAGTPARLLFVSLAMVCIIIAGPVTHGLGGA
jgi:hypothetical protein